jgi:voltage-gated potassium channel
MFDDNKMKKRELLWQGIVFWAIALSVFDTPINFVLDIPMMPWQIVADWIVSMVFLLDTFFNLKKFGLKVKTSKKDQSYHYSKTHFFIDIVSCIPFGAISAAYPVLNALPFLKLVRVFKLIRISKIFSVVGHLMVLPTPLKIQFMTTISMAILHWIACGWILINPAPIDFPNHSEYIKALYFTITTVATIGYGDITPHDDIGRIFTMCIQILGVGMYAVVIGNVTKLVAESDRYKEEAKQKVQSLAIFMKHYHIPSPLQHEVFNFYNHLLAQRLSENDDKIISELPQALRSELQIYMNMNLIKNVPVFKECTHDCLKKIAGSLTQVYYSPEQNVITIGELGKEMFIIGHGEVEVRLADGNTIATLNEGHFFGERALLEETKRSANVVARSYCDLYKLEKEVFLKIVKEYPDLMESMNRIMTQRNQTK